MAGTRGRSRTRKAKPTKKPASAVQTRRPPRRTQPAKELQTTVDESGSILIVNAYDQHPQAFRHLAKMMYISGQAMPSEIARRLGVPIGTVRSWSTRDKWLMLKRQVSRIASKNSVRQARKAMSNYVLDIDRGLNRMLTSLEDRLDNLADEDKMKNEGQILKYVLEILRLKIQLVRTLTYGVQGKAFAPHPENLIFDDTQITPPPNLLQQSNMEEIIRAIPAYMQETAKYVLGFSVDELDDEIIDAVEAHLEGVKTAQEKKKGRKHDLDDDDDPFGVVDDMLDMEEE